MSLVLAVQPDADQASQIAAVCRKVGTELVLAPTAQQAIEALGDRIPDLILSAPLLSSTDEAAIAAHLRRLGTNALHVQALTAPVLGDCAVEPPAPRGLFASFIKPRRETAVPAACDPGVFAEQVSSYLLRAIAERTALTGAPIEAPRPAPEAQSFAMTAIAAPHSLDDFGDEPPFDFEAEGAIADSPQHAQVAAADAELFEAAGDAFEAIDAIPVSHTAAVDAPFADVLMASAPDEPLEEPFESVALDPARDVAGTEIAELEELLESAPAESAFIEHVRSIDVAWNDTGLAQDDEQDSIDLSTLVEELSTDSRQPRRPRERQRKQPQSRRKIQRVYDEDAYFDPERVAFSALVATFDEFTQGA